MAVFASPFLSLTTRGEGIVQGADPNRDFPAFGSNIPLLLEHGSWVSMLSEPYQEIITLDFRVNTLGVKIGTDRDRANRILDPAKAAQRAIHNNNEASGGD